MSPETVQTIIDDLGALLLFTMILIIAAGQISRAIYAVAAQSAPHRHRRRGPGDGHRERGPLGDRRRHPRHQGDRAAVGAALGRPAR